MHEFSISNAITRSVLQSAKDNGAKSVSSIDLEIGELTLLNPSQVRFWLKELLKKTRARNAKIRIKSIKPKVRCKKCKYAGPMKKEDKPLYHFYPPIFACPKCKSTEIKIVKGEECLIKNIRIEKADK